MPSDILQSLKENVQKNPEKWGAGAGGIAGLLLSYMMQRNPKTRRGIAVTAAGGLAGAVGGYGAGYLLKDKDAVGSANEKKTLPELGEAKKKVGINVQKGINDLNNVPDGTVHKLSLGLIGKDPLGILDGAGGITNGKLHDWASEIENGNWDNLPPAFNSMDDKTKQELTKLIASSEELGLSKPTALGKALRTLVQGDGVTLKDVFDPTENSDINYDKSIAGHALPTATAIGQSLAGGTIFAREYGNYLKDKKTHQQYLDDITDKRNRAADIVSNVNSNKISPQAKEAMLKMMLSTQDFTPDQQAKMIDNLKNNKLSINDFPEKGFIFNNNTPWYVKVGAGTEALKQAGKSAVKGQGSKTAWLLDMLSGSKISRAVDSAGDGYAKYIKNAGFGDIKQGDPLRKHVAKGGVKTVAAAGAMEFIKHLLQTKENETVPMGTDITLN